MMPQAEIENPSERKSESPSTCPVEDKDVFGENSLPVKVAVTNVENPGKDDKRCENVTKRERKRNGENDGAFDEAEKEEEEEEKEEEEDDDDDDDGAEGDDEEEVCDSDEKETKGKQKESKKENGEQEKEKVQEITTGGAKEKEQKKSTNNSQDFARIEFEILSALSEFWSRHVGNLSRRREIMSEKERVFYDTYCEDTETLKPEVIRRILRLPHVVGVFLKRTAQIEVVVTDCAQALQASPELQDENFDVVGFTGNHQF